MNIIIEVVLTFKISILCRFPLAGVYCKFVLSSF